MEPSNLKPFPQQLRDWNDLWHRLVSEYTNRALSVESDRLPAIAGIAQAVQSRLQSRYLAGIWMNDLRCSLLWHYTRSLTAVGVSYGKRPKAYRAPTWSWASIEGCVAFDGGPPLADKYVAEIRRAETRQEGRDWTGLVRDGFVEFEACLLDTHLEEDARFDPATATSFDRRWSLGFGQKVEGKWSMMDYLEEDYDISRPGEWQVTEFSDLCCFALGYNEKFDGYTVGMVHPQYRLMVLRRAPTDPESFQRIGLTTLEGDGYRRLVDESVKKVFKVI